MTSTRTQSDDLALARVFPLEGGLSASLTIGLGLVLAVEGAVLHLWIAERSQPWAWAVTAINVVTIAWLWREYRSSRRSRLVVRDADVEIDAGSRLHCHFPRSAIDSAEAATWRSVPDMAPDFVNTAKPLEPNVIVSLRAPVDAKLAFGMRKRVSRIGVRVADAGALRAAIGGSA